MSQFQADQFNYTEHIQTEVLLGNQKLVSPHPEEMLFVIIHQVYELWFKQLLHDTGRSISHLENKELPQATWLIQRMARILKVADSQLGILEMLTCADFQEFRPFLQKSSGLQSRQFRDFEVKCGIAETAGAHYANWAEALWPGILAAHPTTLHAAFNGLIARSGLALLEIYNRRWEQFALFSLCEACLEMDRMLTSWRHNHIQMVKRMIGGRTQGTGGTFVEKYLEPTLKYKIFPELWEVRHEMTSATGGNVAP